MSESTIICRTVDGVATITLNRPDARNALNRAMCEDLNAAVGAIAGDASVRILFVRANGPAFCAGADLKERQGMSVDDVRARRLRAFAAYDAIERLTIPTVAVVHGATLGSGCEIAAACDFIVATPQATFATPEALWGTVGATQRLPRVLGKRLAKDMMFTGRKLSAEEALRAGFVTRVVEPDQIDAVIAEIAGVVVKSPAVGLSEAKRCIDAGVELDPRGALAVELLAIEQNIARGDWRERMSSFGSKS